LVLVLLLAFTVSAACAETVEKAAFNQGLALFKKGDFKSARQAFESSILTNPDNAATHFYLGLTHNRLHVYADAVLAFEKAHELNPALPGVQLNLGISYYKLKTYKPALMSLRRALSEEPESGEANFFTGLTLQGEEQFSRSIPYFNKAAMLEPDYAQMSSYYIGRAYYKTGQRPLAQEALRQSVAIDPTSEIGQMAEDLSTVLTDSHRTEKRWRLRAEIGYEYNDNLTVEQTDTVSDEADHAAVVEIGGGLKLLSQPVEAEITYDFYQSLYSEYSQFNMQSHRAGVAASHDFDSWDFSLGYDYTYIFLDSDEFMRTQSVMPAIGLSFADLYTSVGYIWQAKEFLDDKDEHRDAQNHSGGLDFYLLSLKEIGMINIGVRYEYEDAEDDELDYAGPVLSGSLRLTAPWGIIVRPSYKYHLKKYGNMTVSIGEEREDIKQTLGLSLTKKLPYGLKLKCGYKYIDSDSNYPISEYNENTVFVGLTYSL
jgi:tetratricopeptide (TPR) repeat protein